MEVKRRQIKKKRVNWTIEGESILITLWELKIEDFRTQKRNRHIYQDIAKEMNRRGFSFNENEISIKIHNLTNKYKHEKKRCQSFGCTSEWDHYFRVRALVENTPFSFEEHIKEEMTVNISPDVLLTPLTPDDNVSCKTESDIEDNNHEEPIIKKSKFNDNQTVPKPTINELMKQFYAVDSKLDARLSELKSIDVEMLQIQKELLDTERERNAIFKKISSDSFAFQSDLLNILKNRHVNGLTTKKEDASEKRQVEKERYSVEKERNEIFMKISNDTCTFQSELLNVLKGK